ncbi:MAG: sigma-54-dependent transcriptional regulator [Candidatus Methylomirabilia bacterium]
MSKKVNVLVADDEKNLRELLVRELTRNGHEVEGAADGEEALARLKESTPEVLLLDMKMPRLDGVGLLRSLQELPEAPQVIVLTGFHEVSTAVEAMKLGAYDYLTKPAKIEELDVLIRKAAEKGRLIRENIALRARVEGGEPFAGIVTQSPKMHEVLRIVDRVAPTDSTVLILGESGTGKELVARAIHERSSRARQPFVPIHCGALPREVLESELFGHEKGAFTGAIQTKPGLMELADGGTLFLDEIGEMELDSQVKLLRVLETGSFFRVGGTRTRTVEVRFVTATNKVLEEAIRAGQFRQDLYYRINTIAVTLPPLREHKEDISLLVQHFLQQNAAYGVKRLCAKTLACLEAYDWPGNVRELEHVIQRALILSEGEEIQSEDLPPEVQCGEPAPGLSPGSLEAMERQQIISTLRQVGGHRGKASTLLGIDPKTLYRKILAYKVSPDLYK